MSSLFVIEEPAYQTPNERIIRTQTTTNWVSSPTSPSVKAYDETQGNLDVTATVVDSQPGAPSGDVITLGLLKSLTINHSYRIETKFNVGSGIYEIRSTVKCVRLYAFEEPFEQSADEEIPYKITTTLVKSSPTSPTVKVYDENQGNLDVTSDVGALTGSASGDVITLSVLKDLTVGHSYRVDVTWTVSTEIFERSFRVRCVF